MIKWTLAKRELPPKDVEVDVIGYDFMQVKSYSGQITAENVMLWKHSDPVADHGPELLARLSHIIDQIDDYIGRGFGVVSMIDTEDARELLRYLEAKP